MCYAGVQGTVGYVMPKEDVIPNMARLSLTKGIRLAMSEVAPWYGLTPYVGCGVNQEELISQISLKSFLNQYGTPEERVLSILLRNPEEIGLERYGINMVRHAKYQDVY